MRTITVDEGNHHPSSLTNLGVRSGGGVPAVVITRLDPSLPETVVEGGVGRVVEEVVKGWFKAV